MNIWRKVFGRNKPVDDTSRTQINPETASRPDVRIPQAVRPAGALPTEKLIGGRFAVQAVFGGPGHSGMGVVYICRDKSTSQMVAAKTFQADRFGSDELQSRFRTEAEIWVKMGKHPNVVQALAFQVLDGQPYLIMECVPRWGRLGPDLRSWMGDARWSIDGVLWLSLHVCNGMDFTTRTWAQQGRRFVHRDLKPENLLVAPLALSGVVDALPLVAAERRNSWFPPDYMVKVTDLGLASVVESTAATTLSSASESRGASGTPLYMSPEQIRGEVNLDARSDIYAFGCILYELTVGQTPFTGASADEILGRHLHAPPIRPKIIRTSVPDGLDALIMACLEKSPDSRPPTFENLRDSVAELLAAELGGSYDSDHKELRYSKDDVCHIYNTVLCTGIAHQAASRQSDQSTDDLTEYLARVNWMIAAEKGLEKLSREESFDQACSVGRLGQHGEAERMLIEHLRQWPEDMQARICLGQSQFFQGRSQDAINTLEYARASSPGVPDLYRWLAEAHKKSGQPNTAIEILRDGLARCPNPHPLWYDLAVLQDKAGKRRDARTAYETFLEAASSLRGFDEQISWARKRLREL